MRVRTPPLAFGLRLRLMLTLTAVAILPIVGVSYVVVHDEVGNAKRAIAFELHDASVAAQARLSGLLARRELSAIAAASSQQLQTAIRRHRTARLERFAEARGVVLEVRGRHYGRLLPHALSSRAQLVANGRPVGAVVTQLPLDATTLQRLGPVAHGIRLSFGKGGRVHASLSPHLQAARTSAAYGRVERAGSLAVLALMLLSFVLARPLLRTLRWTEERAGESRVDALTGIANRRGLEEALEAEISRAERFGHGLAVVLLDLDHFKRVNDTHGHEAGDLLLREVGRLLAATGRRQDTVARWGGEEFVVVLPETELAGAHRLAERLRVAVAELEVGPIRTTASGGVAALQAGDTVATLLAAADGALYRAKAKGRNRTEKAARGASSAAA